MSEVGQRTPFGAQVADSIRGQISAGELQAGDVLPSEAQLAERYGVSQRVIRDALRSLANVGVIETRQGKRALVRDLKPVAVGTYMRLVLDTDNLAMDEFMEFRALLEGYVSRLAAERATPPQVAAMRAALQAIADAGDDVDKRVRGDLELHGIIAAASGNRFISGILTTMADILAEERRLGGELIQSTGADHQENDAQHAELVDAIAAGRADEAGRTGTEIVDRARERHLGRRHPGANQEQRRRG